MQKKGSTQPFTNILSCTNGERLLYQPSAMARLKVQTSNHIFYSATDIYLLRFSQVTNTIIPGQIRPKYFKSWHSQLPFLTFSIKRVSVEIGLQVRLLCPWARHLTGLPLPSSGSTDSNRVAAWIEDRKGHFAVSWSRYLNK